jgi:hypothetical protein
MLTIKLNPVRSDSLPLSVYWNNPVIKVNSIDYDLSELPIGATAVHPVLGEVNRTDNDYFVVLTLPHGANAPHETRFPAGISVTENGPVTIPPYDTEVI